MSFSSDVKTELCKAPLGRKCCALAEAYGVLLYCHTYRQREIRIITANDAFAARLPRLFRRAFDCEFDHLPPEAARGKRSFILQNEEIIYRIYSAYGQEPSLVHHINYAMLENDCCRQSFFRGAFLAGGSVTDPEKRYHLEFLTSHHSVARESYTLLLEMNFSPKESSRAGGSILYFKHSETIEDFLTTMGAPLAAVGIMQAKMEKDMRNAVNRRVNCDSANADKIVAAAQEQLELLREIDRRIGLDSLPEVLQETAMLRIANPESSLSDLARLASPPVTKSCMSHRMKKLLSMKEED